MKEYILVGVIPILLGALIVFSVGRILEAIFILLFDILLLDIARWLESK